MSVPSRGDKIDPFDPLPGVGEPAGGRWAAPYLSSKTGLWTVHIRRPLTRRQMDAGLTDTIWASTPEALEVAMKRQDGLAEALAAGRDTTPTWSRGM